jgi:cysteine desulfurase
MKYFDYAASCPLDQDAAKLYVEMATENFGNTSSLHDIGGQAASLLDHCRETFARMLGVDKRGLYFTSGGSESNFLAIEALLNAPKRKGQHIITTLAEHSSIHSSLRRLESYGYELTLLPFDSNGLVNIESLQQAIRPDTVLVVIQHTNSEIGTIQPVEAIADICQEHDIHFHCDFVQGLGKWDSRRIAHLVSSFSFAGHKFYGPKGVGGLFIQPSINWQPFFPGTTHESGLRPGTVNLPGIVAMTVAAEKTIGQMTELNTKFNMLRELLLEKLTPIENVLTIHGSTGTEQFPGIIGLSIAGMEGQWLMLECNRLGYAISTGSACASGKQNPSRAMQAIGITGKTAKEFARISFGRMTTKEDVEMLGDTIVRIAREFNRGK